MICLGGGCRERAVPTDVRCVEHLGNPGDRLLAVAECLALSVLVGHHQWEFMDTARYEGAITWLLTNDAPARIRWLEKNALIKQDFSDTLFPPYLRMAADQWMAEQEERTEILLG